MAKVNVYLDDNGFYYGRMRSTKLCYIRFEDEYRLNEFFESLPLYSTVRIYLDLADTELEIDQVPELKFWERSKYMETHQLRALKKNTLLSDFQLMGVTGQHYIRKLAVLASEEINRFFERLVDRRAIITGAHSVEHVVESNRLWQKVHAAHKETKGQPLLMIIRRDATSYRQFFILDDRVVLSRVVEIPEDVTAVDEFYDYLARESDMGIRFLYNEKLVEFGKAFSIVIYEPDEVLSAGIQPDAFLRETMVSTADWLDQSYLIASDSIGRLCRRKGVSGVHYLPELVICLEKPLKAVRGFQHEAINLSKAVLYGRNGLVVFSLLFLMLGAYFIGSYASQYFFLDDRISYLDNRISYLKKTRADLQSRIDIPYDARDLKTIVDFSESFRKIKEDRSLARAVAPMMALMNQNPDIRLLKLDVQRIKDRQQVLSPRIRLIGKFLMTKPAVLYADNLARINRFADAFSATKNYDAVKLVQLPIRPDPRQSQAVDETMLMPETLTFEMNWEWSSNAQ